MDLYTLLIFWRAIIVLFPTYNIYIVFKNMARKAIQPIIYHTQSQFTHITLLKIFRMNENLVHSKLGLMKPLHSEPVDSHNIVEKTKNKSKPRSVRASSLT